MRSLSRFMAVGPSDTSPSPTCSRAASASSWKWGSNTVQEFRWDPVPLFVAQPLVDPFLKKPSVHLSSSSNRSRAGRVASAI